MNLSNNWNKMPDNNKFVETKSQGKQKFSVSKAKVSSSCEFNWFSNASEIAGVTSSSVAQLCIEPCC